MLHIPFTSTRKKFLFTIFLLLMAALLVRVFRVNIPKNYYFDEVYHAFTATTYLHNDPRGYEYWASPPEGVAYEWTHPPFAKLAMTAGMVVFGENSFGWRISSVLFGTGVIAMIGIIAHQLFRTRTITLLAISIAAMDGLLLAMSRIAMNDMHFVFFMLLGASLYLEFKKVAFEAAQWKKKILLISGIAFSLGLALASKWTTLYAGAALGVDFILTCFLLRKLPIKTIFLGIIVAGILVPVTYLASYGQFFLQGHTLTQWKETTQQMWWYHTGLKATHPFQSRPYQWILDLRPVWMHVEYDQAGTGKLSHVYNPGNPIIFLLGLIIALYYALRGILSVAETSFRILFSEKKVSLKAISQPLVFLCILYLTLWVPWIFSPRIMFFYHYSPAVPFLVILLSYGLFHLQRTGKLGKIVTLGILLGILVAFVGLFPINTGFPMPQAYFDTIFKIFPTWK